MSARPGHDVLVPVHDGERHLGATLECLLAQDVPGLRVIVSDNASGDGTPAVLAGFARDPRLVVSRSPVDVGMFGNWDRLMRMVEAPTHTLISHDDLLSAPDVLGRAVAALEAEPDCPAVFSDIAYIDDAGRRAGTRRFARSGPFDARDWIRRSVLSCRNQLGLPIAVRTEAARGLRFDERLRYAGDLGFAAALASRMGRPVHIPEPLFLYRMHGAGGTLRLQHHALADMRRIAGQAGIALSPVEAMRQRAAFHAVSLARAATLRTMPLRSRLGRALGR